MKNNIIIACLMLCSIFCSNEDLVAGTRKLVIYDREVSWKDIDISSYADTKFALMKTLPPDTATAYYGDLGKNGAVIIATQRGKLENGDEDMYARDLNIKNLFIRRGIVAGILYLFLLVTILSVPFLLYREAKCGINSQIVVNSLVVCSWKHRFWNMFVDWAALRIWIYLSFMLGIICRIAAGTPHIDVYSISKIFHLFPILFIFCYFFYMEYFCGRTLGKFLTKSIVVDEQGNKPTAKAILIRTLCRLIPFDCLSFLFYEEERAQGHCIFWHDKLSHTRVVQNMQSY